MLPGRSNRGTFLHFPPINLRRFLTTIGTAIHGETLSGSLMSNSPSLAVSWSAPKVLTVIRVRARGLMVLQVTP